MTNQIDENEPTVKYYDIVYQFKEKDHLPKELALIQSLLKKNSKILDVGCGTGRHTIPLFLNGYDITGFDFSQTMLDRLKVKNPDIKTIQGDFLNYSNYDIKYDLVMCFWNAISEIARTQESLELFFQQADKLMSPKGQLIVNFDDASTLDPDNFTYSDKIRTEDKEYTINWVVKGFDRSTNSTVSEEEVIEKDLATGKSESTKTQITQKWWFRDDLIEVARKFDMVVTEYVLEEIDEVYLVLSKE